MRSVARHGNVGDIGRRYSFAHEVVHVGDADVAGISWTNQNLVHGPLRVGRRFAKAQYAGAVRAPVLLSLLS